MPPISGIVRLLPNSPLVPPTTPINRIERTTMLSQVSPSSSSSGGGLIMETVPEAVSNFRKIIPPLISNGNGGNGNKQQQQQQQQQQQHHHHNHHHQQHQPYDGVRSSSIRDVEDNNDGELDCDNDNDIHNNNIVNDDDPDDHMNYRNNKNSYHHLHKQRLYDDVNTIIQQDDITNSTRWGQMKSFYAEHCIYLPAMLGWFIFSAGLSAYNKLIFSKTHRGFKCPLLLTSVHFFAQWIFGYIVTSLFPLTCGTDRVRRMNWNDWWSVSLPCSLVTSGDVGLSNLSLVTITMTFYTMIKSSTPIFVLAWAYLFGIETITWNLLFVVLIIAFGEIMTVAGEVDFDPIGFCLCLSASVLSGARWTLVQLKLRSMEPPLKTPIATMRLLAPCMFWSMLFVSMVVERPWIKLKNIPMEHIIFDLVVLGMIGAVLAISMILCEFWLIMRSNAIVLMLGGVLKEMITIVVGVAYFGDELNRINISGCFVVFVGVFYYKFTNYVDSKEKEKYRMQQLPQIQLSNTTSSSTKIMLMNDHSDRGGLNNNTNGIITKGIQMERIASRSPIRLSTNTLRGYSMVMGHDDVLDRTEIGSVGSSSASSSVANVVGVVSGVSGGGRVNNAQQRVSRNRSEAGESTSELSSALRRTTSSSEVL